jgi:hypothetical protein
LMVARSIYRYIGLVHCRIHKSFDGAIKTVTASRNPDGKYFVSVLVDDGKANPESVAVIAVRSRGEIWGRVLCLCLPRPMPMPYARESTSCY